eukprot:MONOS_1733.2-p1 / transcript=MONOS_1733.2 / gene=MONOS_1733 / organism=Monocercomonoides_exilis_PA203 / gene_product=unspecified product / transcript_product=unspecified product / location=Mono_scaffold00032:82737-83414(+) / protein_length=202 / sequence_SO=supercontig / SO=protein_coding / is_pseudo=false
MYSHFIWAMLFLRRSFIIEFSFKWGIQHNVSHVCKMHINFAVEYTVFYFKIKRDPDTGKVYKQIDDGSGKPQWIEENNMCTKKYIDGLGYVSCPSPDWKPGCGPTILKEPPKGVQKQLDQMGKCGMFPNMFESSGESSNSDCASQQVPLASYSQTPSSSSSQTEPSSGRSEPRSSRKSSSRCPRSARNSERDAIRRGGVNW